jgi:hypothetical protein
VEAHIDDMDVIAIQSSGSKTWQVESSAVPFPEGPIRRLDASHRLPAKYRRPETITLQADDVLYVPRGVIHNTSSGSEASIHLSVGIEPLPEKVLVRLARAFAPPKLSLVEAVTGVEPSCFSQGSARQLLLAVAASNDFRWRAAIALPTNVPLCAAGSPELDGIADLRSRIADLWQSGVVEDLQVPGSAAELAKLVLTEASLMKHIDAWVASASQCNRRAAQVASQIESSARKDYAAAGALLAKAATEWASALQTEVDWCQTVSDFHKAACAAEEEARVGDAAWAKANRRLMELRLAQKPSKPNADL